MPLDIPAAQVPSNEALKALKIIDSDTHFSEPHDLWISQVPAGSKFRDRVPQVRTLDGVKSWTIDVDKIIGRGAETVSAILKDGSKSRGLDFRSNTIEKVHEGSWKLKPRLALMDEQNVWAHIVYPNILGFGGQRSAKVDPELRLVCVQLYNDYMANLQKESNGRFFPMALLPWWDVKQAVVEMERCAKLGMRGININPDPHDHVGNDGKQLPDLGSTYWNPLWEVCVDKNLPVNFHVGASESSVDWQGKAGWPGTDQEMRTAMQGTMIFFNNGKVMANVIFSGLLDRYPGLKFVSVESGVGWIPFTLESLDYQYAEIATRKQLQRTPTEYFKANFYACFWFERKDIVPMVRSVGIDNCLFETDFPHPTSLYPINNAAFALPGFTEEERKKVLSTNAAKVYNIAV